MLPPMRDALAQLDLNLLYTYLLVVDAGGVGKVATLLGRTQPAVTLRLRQLESALGAQLVTRSGRGVIPTMLGRSLLPDIRRIVERARAIVDLAQSAQPDAQGTMRIGVLPMVGVHLLAPALAAIAPDFPKVSFELHPAFTNDALEALSTGRIDLALTVGELTPTPSLHIEPLALVQPVLVFPRGLLPRRPVTPKALARHAIIGYGAVHDPFFDAVHAFLATHSLDACIRVRVPHIQTMKALVRAGLGVAIVPDYTATDADLDSARVVGLELSQPLSAALRPELLRMPIVQRLMSAMRR